MKTITTLPPIEQYFNYHLLENPFDDSLRFDSRRLFAWYKFYLRKLQRKSYHSDIRRKKCELLEQEFLQLYERIKIKEEELEEKTKHITKRPFFYITYSDYRSKKLYDRFRFSPRV